MTQHTKGPWRVDQGCYAVRADALPLSAKTGLDSGVVCVAVHSPADARLIAAAPEMYAALKALLFEIERVEQYSRFRDGDTLRAATTASILLAKVEGR